MAAVGPRELAITLSMPTGGQRRQVGTTYPPASPQFSSVRQYGEDLLAQRRRKITRLRSRRP